MKKLKNHNVDLISNNDPLDKNRGLIEDLWESVLREECPDDQADRLIQLKELSYSNQGEEDSSRSFKNGTEFGVFFSKTNVSTEEFGEGSFDKGIFFNIPISLI